MAFLFIGLGVGILVALISFVWAYTENCYTVDKDIIPIFLKAFVTIVLIISVIALALFLIFKGIHIRIDSMLEAMK